MNEKPEKKARRKIPGDIPYTSTPGKFKEILDKAITAERPQNFNSDFMDKVLGFAGGSASQTPPLLKRAKLLDANGQPTDLYSKFKTGSGRSDAAYLALKNAFPSVFAKSEYAHKASREKLQDLLIEITGLEKEDSILRSMAGTFEAMKSFITEPVSDQVDPALDESSFPHVENPVGEMSSRGGISLSTHVHVVLPNTTDIKVYDAIFRSLRENLIGS